MSPEKSHAHAHIGKSPPGAIWAEFKRRPYLSRLNWFGVKKPVEKTPAHGRSGFDKD
jgi:hypothetical protein